MATFPIAKADLIEGMAKGMAVLESFDTERQRLNATLVAQRTGLTRAAARRHLLTLAHLGHHLAQGAALRDGVGREPLQHAALQPLREFGRGQRGQQHPPGRCGVRWQPRPQVQAIGHGARWRALHPAARHDHHFIPVQHHGRERLLRLRRQPVQRGLQHTRQPG